MLCSAGLDTLSVIPIRPVVAAIEFETELHIVVRGLHPFLPETLEGSAISLVLILEPTLLQTDLSQAREVRLPVGRSLLAHAVTPARSNPQ